MNEEKFRQATSLRQQILGLEERLEQLKLLPDVHGLDNKVDGLYVRLYPDNILCIRASEDFDFYHDVIARCVEKIEGLLEEKRKLYEEL